jgi:hypothetical protein
MTIKFLNSVIAFFLWEKKIESETSEEQRRLSLTQPFKNDKQTYSRKSFFFLE